MGSGEKQEHKRWLARLNATRTAVMALVLVNANCRLDDKTAPGATETATQEACPYLRKVLKCAFSTIIAHSENFSIDTEFGVVHFEPFTYYGESESLRHRNYVLIGRSVNGILESQLRDGKLVNIRFAEGVPGISLGTICEIDMIERDATTPAYVAPQE
jgi:hypothetical protein